jgi:hypothetical protein
MQKSWKYQVKKNGATKEEKKLASNMHGRTLSRKGTFELLIKSRNPNRAQRALCAFLPSSYHLVPG